jgi:hypothetical protein
VKQEINFHHTTRACNDKLTVLMVRGLVIWISLVNTMRKMTDQLLDEFSELIAGEAHRIRREITVRVVQVNVIPLN